MKVWGQSADFIAHGQEARFPHPAFLMGFWERGYDMLHALVLHFKYNYKPLLMQSGAHPQNDVPINDNNISSWFIISQPFWIRLLQTVQAIGGFSRIIILFLGFIRILQIELIQKLCCVSCYNHYEVQE